MGMAGDWPKEQIDMSKLLAGLGGNAGAVAAGAVVVGVLTTGAWIGNSRETPATVAPAAFVQTVPDTPIAETVIAVTAPDNETGSTDEAATDEVAIVVVPAPSFDEVRRESDGMTVVAGRAVPGALVKLLQDGVEIAATTADGAGKFATLTMIAPDGVGHVLSLVQTANGGDVPSSDEIILAPIAAPVVVAQAPAADELSVTAQGTPNTEVSQTPEPESTPAETIVVNKVTETGAEVAIASVASGETTTNEPVQEVITETETPTEVTTQSSEQTPVAEPSTEVAVLKSTAQGVELLNPAAPLVMDTVALDTISYSDIGDVQLAGRAQADSETVRVYLDNDAVISLPVDEQGRWRGDVPDVDEGIYTLRVDEVGADGSVTSRVETPFKRETPAVLAQAAQKQKGPIKAITVQAGATLWAIARERYGDGQLYVRVFKANESDIRDPDLIYPGQIFDLPD